MSPNWHSNNLNNRNYNALLSSLTIIFLSVSRFSKWDRWLLMITPGWQVFQKKRGHWIFSISGCTWKSASVTYPEVLPFHPIFYHLNHFYDSFFILLLFTYLIFPSHSHMAIYLSIYLSGWASNEFKNVRMYVFANTSMRL